MVSYLVLRVRIARIFKLSGIDHLAIYRREEYLAHTRPNLSISRTFAGVGMLKIPRPCVPLAVFGVYAHTLKCLDRRLCRRYGGSGGGNWWQWVGRRTGKVFSYRFGKSK